MIFSAHEVLSLVTLCPIAIFAILTKIRHRNANLKRKSSMLQYEIGPEKKRARLDEEDLINQLPDDILVSILSRMSTKDAARTSLLSRRWRNLHRFLPVYDIELDCFYLLKHVLVDFGIRTDILSQRWRSLYRCLSIIESCCGNLLAQQDPHNSELVINSLDRFLTLQSGYKIHSFRLHCCLSESVTDRFEQCIYSLGRLGVEKLFLECCCYRYTSDLSFSCHLFAKMPSLKYFQLRKCSLQPSLRSQCSSLQTIVLMYVAVSPGAVECILSDCLRLQSLTMTSCKCPPKLSFCGPHLELKSLYINGCEGVEEIEFYASNLVVFEFWNRKMVNLIFDHVPQLQSVYLNIFLENIVPYVCGRLASDLPHLKSLNFVTPCVNNIQENDINMEINMFSNLRRLHINMHSRPKIDLLLLTSILQHCPLLQEFHLSVNLWGNVPRVEIQVAVFHTELKKMEIGGFGGTEYEMEFALYVLKSAINLEKMHISKCIREYEGFLTGSGRWCARPATRWSKKVKRMIHTRLQGQAVSKIAQVIIQHTPPTHFEDCLEKGEI